LTRSFCGRKEPCVLCTQVRNTSLLKQTHSRKECADVEADPTFPGPRYVDHAIDLESGSAPAMGPIFGLAPHELEDLRNQLDDLLEKDLVEPSCF